MNDPDSNRSTPARPALGARVLGVVLLFFSVGLVSCQALFSW
ncbi:MULTISPECIES: hypothetical protein [Marichromatium]|uniref:Uncharacterized protein n=1 Tax=Marichromatium gracile TaxID=1048 RepID=A0A4R4ABI1_MARGR|nr:MULTISPECIES: hypothetical protein [Marichromatium]TCW36382.1 hypothetical protein EDC29_104170 [Marichromatium gracile]